MTQVKAQPANPTNPPPLSELISLPTTNAPPNPADPPGGPIYSSSPPYNILYMVTKGDALRYPKPTALDIVVTDLYGLATATSWHVMIFTTTAPQLIEASSEIVPLLCPPPPPLAVFANPSSWLPRSGKLLRIRQFTTADAKSWVDLAVQRQFDILHFDAGWYGEENNKESVATNVHPSIANQLNIKDVANYAASKNIAVTLYVNELALRDTDKLAPLYSSWGVKGIKFGFVATQTPKHMRILHQRIIRFGMEKIFVNVHDYYRPRGLSRTYPHLITQEGIRGEERKPDCSHHTYLAFVRLLAGAADYTPRFNEPTLRVQCSHTHQLALPIILFSPLQSLFWAQEYARIIAHTKEFDTALQFWSRIPTRWDDTRPIDGKIGDYIITARRSDHSWFVCAITNNHQRSLLIDLSILFKDLSNHPSQSIPIIWELGYLVRVWSDGSDYHHNNNSPHLIYSSVHEYYLSANDIRKILNEPLGKESPAPLQSDGTLYPRFDQLSHYSIDMAPSGGHCLHFSPYGV